MGAGDVVHNIGVLASDAVLDGLGLTSQGACVCVCIFGVNTTKTSCLSTLFEVWQHSEGVDGESSNDGALETNRFHLTMDHTMQILFTSFRLK